MVTMRDVAQKAGVSKSTVSRVLNGKNIVRREVAEKVFKAIEETGYRPNLLAQQLANQKTNFIGFVVTNALYDGPYFSSLVYYAASFSEQHGRQLVMADGKHSARDEKNAINFLLDMKCAGIIVYPKYLTEKDLKEIRDSTSIPIVILNRDLTADSGYCITTDHYKNASLMMEHIIDQGHQDIAFISGLADSSTGIQRLQAYQDALLSHDISINPELVISAQWTSESGYQAAKQLVNSGAHFSAVLAGNDDMALGAMKAFVELGFNLPKDISIAGFDNSKMGAFLTPSLTSVSIPLEKMIQKGILTLLGEHSKAEQICTKGSLIIRDSVTSKA
ncbi:LacI family DNA-binding transcriptional regulator [Vibrio aphrogenes]|uniref:LacI family DNA-binding transcriptional regulator n=1 Tax=Vibrio aphrogenes TaxID=1891186 RepID=UPI000B34D0C9|nr:LacI family DNA-binding transcriptional regulator [Vibrio aphrogenes]